MKKTAAKAVFFIMHSLDLFLLVESGAKQSDFLLSLQRWAQPS